MRGTVSGGTIQTTISGQWGLNAVTVMGVSNVILQDLIVQNGSGTASKGVFVNNPGGGLSRVSLQNVTVKNNGGIGVEVQGSVTATFDNVTVRNNGVRWGRQRRGTARHPEQPGVR